MAVFLYEQKTKGKSFCIRPKDLLTRQLMDCDKPTTFSILLSGQIEYYFCDTDKKNSFEQKCEIC